MLARDLCQGRLLLGLEGGYASAGLALCVEEVARASKVLSGQLFNMLVRVVGQSLAQFAFVPLEKFSEALLQPLKDDEPFAIKKDTYLASSST